MSTPYNRGAEISIARCSRWLQVSRTLKSNTVSTPPLSSERKNESSETVYMGTFIRAERDGMQPGTNSCGSQSVDVRASGLPYVRTCVYVSSLDLSISSPCLLILSMFVHEPRYPFFSGRDKSAINTFSSLW